MPIAPSRQGRSRARDLWRFAVPIVAVVVIVSGLSYLAPFNGRAQAKDQPDQPLAVSDSTCAGDVNGDSVVNVNDLLVVINQWGPCGGCSGDTNGDGVVDVTDLLTVINGWGPCSNLMSCDGHCGVLAPGGCSCHPSCFTSGNCCEDICKSCEFMGCNGSCAGACGGIAPAGCWCDSQCAQFYDCCRDACVQCNWPNGPPCELAPLCYGYCGGQSPFGCWCDERCCLFGDCCYDKWLACGGCCTVGICP
jgi:hypothetical protein